MQLKKIKFGLFEVLLAVFFLLIAASLYFFLFRTKKETVVVIKTAEENLIRFPWENDIVNTKLWNTSLLLNNVFQPGMSEKDSLGRNTAELLRVNKYDNRPENPTYYLTVKLQTVYTPGTKLYTFKGKNVLIGSTVNLNLDNIVVQGLIVKVDTGQKNPPLKKIRVSAQIMNNDNIFQDTTGVYKYIDDNINTGDSVTDSQGNTILKITDKQSWEADQIIKTPSGDVYLRKNPLLRDIYLELEVLVYYVNNRYIFFDDIPLLVDKQVPLHLNNISVFPVITKIEEVK